MLVSHLLAEVRRGERRRYDWADEWRGERRPCSERRFSQPM